jgi:hypothetical protein
MANDDEGEDFSVLGQLQMSTKQEGLSPGTPEYEQRLDQMKVQRCRELRGFPICSDCPVFDFCELVKRVMRNNQGY